MGREENYQYQSIFFRHALFRALHLSRASWTAHCFSRVFAFAAWVERSRSWSSDSTGWLEAKNPPASSKYFLDPMSRPNPWNSDFEYFRSDTKPGMLKQAELRDRAPEGANN